MICIFFTLGLDLQRSRLGLTLSGEFCS